VWQFLQYLKGRALLATDYMNCIVAVFKDWAIGYENKLLAKNPIDMKYFKEKTLGKVVVMGRKTLESFPGGLPLKDRINIVLTTKPDYKVEGVVKVSSVWELEKELEKYNLDDVFVIGGESVYKQLLAKCQKAYVTKVESDFPADTWFPNLDDLEDWKLMFYGKERNYEGLKFRFTIYERF
jgi:dihydrofolate reductase